MDFKASRKAVEEEYSSVEYVEGQCQAGMERNDQIAGLFHSAVQKYCHANYGDSTTPSYGRLVDVGCGAGRQTKELAKHFEHTLGLDTSELQIAKAKEIATGNNIEFCVGKGENIPVDDESVDVISGVFVEKFLDMEKFVPECHRVLKPGGIVVFCGSFTSDVAPVKEPLISDPNILQKSSELWDQARLNFRRYAKETSHPRWHSLQWCEELFEDIKGIKKTRETSSYQLEMTMSKFRDFLYCSPFYKEATGAPFEVFCTKLKKLWNMENAADEEVVVRLTAKAYVIILLK